MISSTNPLHRLKNIDALRGLCAVLVLLQHFLSHRAEGQGLLQYDPAFYLDFGRIGVVAFFLISGYVIPFSIPKGEQPIKRFWIARFFRLWPAYWVSIILAIAIGSAEIPLTVRNIAVNLTMLQKFVGVGDMIGSFWTLQIELIFYLIISVIVVWGDVRNIRTYRTGFYSMIAVTLAISLVRWHWKITLPVAIPMALTLMFLAGYLRQCRLTNHRYPRLAIAAYICSLIPICFIAYGGKLRISDDPYRWIAAYLVGLGLFIIFELLKSAPAFAVFLGTISYSFYLLHVSFIKVDELLFGQRKSWFDLVFIFLLTVLISWAVYRLVEFPSQTLGKKLAKRAPAQPLVVDAIV